MTQEYGIVDRKDVGIDIKYDRDSLKNYKIVHPGDYVISLRSFQGGFELSETHGIVSPAYTVFNFLNEGNNILFWKYLFKRDDFIQSLKTVTYGIRDGKSISFKEFSDLKVHFPTENEQTGIGQLLACLDTAIASNQRDLNKS